MEKANGRHCLQRRLLNRPKEAKDFHSIWHPNWFLTSATYLSLLGNTAIVPHLPTPRHPLSIGVSQPIVVAFVDTYIGTAHYYPTERSIMGGDVGQ
jgi:hypothetical protein